MTTGSPSLGRTLRNGALISAMTFVVLQVVALVQIVALARLLSPAEIGLFAAGSVLTGFLVSTSADGLAVALIQRDDEGDLEDTANTVFWATLGTGLLLSLAAPACAPLIGLLFGVPAAATIAAATSAVALLHALTVVPDALMQRRFDFRRRMIVNPAMALTNTGTAVGCALAGLGVWSLVIANYAAHLVWITLSWLLCGWRPGRGRPSLRLWRELARFAAPLVVNGTAWRLREVIETAWVGRRLDESAVGWFRYGRRLAMLPGTAVVEIGGYVLLPAFARMVGQPERFRVAFVRALAAVWTMAVALAVIMVALGEPVVALVLGEPWRPAGVALAAMAGFVLGEGLGSVADEAVKGSGRSHLLNWSTATGLISTIVLLWLLMPLGMVGVGLAISGANLLTGLVGLAVAGLVVRCSPLDLLGSLIPSVVAGTVATGAVWFLEREIVRSSERGLAMGLLSLIGEVVVALVLYLGVLRSVAPRQTRDLLASVRRFAAGRS